MSDLAGLFGLNRSGQFNGVPGPIKLASRYFIPPQMAVEASGVTVSTTGARYYVAPFYIERPTTFAGSWNFNSGAGDNGDKAKMSIYSESASGGPGARAKSFGEITYTGASAVRTHASSWAASAGMYYLEFVTDNTVAMFTMGAIISTTAAGIWMPNAAANLTGMSVPTVGAAALGNAPGGAEYVGGTYANFPEATSLTPATTLFGQGVVPLFGLYT